MDNKGKNNISYSQISMYNDCNYKWYLTYIKKLKTFEHNIHLLFGTSMHFVIQAYLTKMYTTTAKEADEMDLNAMLKAEMIKNFTDARTSNEKDPCSKEDLMSFYMDGVAILDFLKKHRADYFNKKGCELIGCEVALQVELKNNIIFVGYIDIAIKDNIADKIKIVDLKTSTNGWKDYQKNDITKTSQLVLYKKFYSEVFNVPIKDIDIEFIILKRKLYENSDFPQKRIQRFVPASGTTTVNQLNTRLNEFIDTCFTPEGTYNENRVYRKVTEIKKCKFCPFLGKECKGANSEEAV